MRHFLALLVIVLAGIQFSSAQEITLDLGSQSGNTITDEVISYGWIRDDQPTRIAGGETAFIGTAGTQDFRGFIAFDLSAFSTADTINAATISLFSEGADTFDANGPATDDANSIDLNITSLAEVTGYGDGAGNNAVLDSDGTTPAEWDNLNTLYGEVLDTATLDLDNIAVNQEVQFDVTAEIAAAVGAGASKLTFGLTSPDAIATGVRNFFAFEGVDQGAETGGSIGPNLSVDYIPEFDISDVNQDGIVSTLDFQQISDDLFKSVDDLTGVNINSDIDGSGLVDFADFRTWKNTPQGAAVIASMRVPEPSTGVTIALVVAAAALRFRRRQA